MSTEKEQENFVAPPEVLAAIDEVIDRHGRKRKWVVYVAAILSFLEEGERGMAERIGRVAAAEHTGGYGKLLDDARGLGGLNDRGPLDTGGVVSKRAVGGPAEDGGTGEPPGGAGPNASRRGKRH